MKLPIGLALAGVAALSLAGCTSLFGPIANPISQTTAYEVITAYGIAQSGAVAYTVLPRCAPGTHASATNYCREQSIVVALANADAKVQIARRALESFARNPANYPGLSYSQVLNAFQLAVTTLSQIEASSGVH